MKTKNLIVTLIIVTFVAFSCGGKKTYDENSKSGESEIVSEESAIVKTSAQEDQKSGYAPTSTSETIEKSDAEGKKDDYAAMISSSAAQMSKFDSTHKLIRTAELKFRALDVTQTAFNIEDIVKKFGGFTASTDLSSKVTGKETTRISPDSLIETTTYHFTNEVVVRVPAKNMDTVLKCLVPMIDFLDYRNIKAEDVSLAYLRKQLIKKRLDLYNIQVSGLTTSGNTGDRLAAMESQLQKQIQNDEALIERLELDDQVSFATITLHIYGRDKTRHVMLPDEDRIDSYKPGFGKKLMHAIRSGWQVLQLFVIGLITLWPLWLAGALVWFIIARINKNKKSKQLPK